MTHKYGAKRTDCRRGHSHPSRKEANRCNELCLLEAGGEIEGLEFQPEFKLEINNELICKYRADFSYVDARTGKEVIEDVKGQRLPIYILKRKLMRALLGIHITET